MSLLLTKQIIQMFLMMFCGWMIVRLGVLRSEESRALSVITIFIICPASVLNAFQIDYTPEIADNFRLALRSGVMIHVIVFLTVYALNILFRFSGIEKASLIYSNAGNLIIPLVLAILGEEWVIYASAFIFTQQAVLWSHGKSVIEGKRGMDLKAMFKNVNLLACFTGLIMFLLRLKFPSILQGAVRSLGGIIGPVTMLTMGMILAGTDMGKMIRGKRIWIIALLKMILIPGTVILAMKLSGIAASAPDGRTVLFISLLACMTPTATSVTQMARLYECEPEYATAINTVTTVMCLVTMPLMTLLYEL